MRRRKQLPARATLASPPHIRILLAIAGFAFVTASLSAQSTGTTVRRHRTQVVTSGVAPAVLEAEAALQKDDYATAESLLHKVTAQDSQDYRAWFDLGFVYRATKRPTEAIDAYRKSLAIKPSLFEANVDLGQLLAQKGDDIEAEKYLRAATQLKPESNAG